MDCSDIFTVVGLSLDAIGIVLLFCFAPEKFPDPQSRSFFKLVDGYHDEWEKKQIVRKWVVGFGVGIMLLGFALQAVAVIFW